jgi:ADP-heptose:LPS heptosyltransferase
VKIARHRILFLAEGQLGDLLLLTPALQAAKESFPDSSISVLVVNRRNADESKEHPFSNLAASPFERESSVLSTNTNVDELLVLSRQALRALHGIARIKAEISIIGYLRRKKFDTVICTFPEDRFAQWAFASGARIRVGQRKQGLHWLLTHKPNIEKSERGVLEYYCNLVRTIGANVTSNKTEYVIPESSLQWTKELFHSKSIASTEKVVAIHPGASTEFTIWPPENFAAVIDHLTNNLDAKVLLVGGRGDQPATDAIKQHLHSSILEIETSSRVGDLAAVLQRCTLCMSNDSGPRHLAIAVGTPSLAFFRQHNEIWKEFNVYQESNRIASLRSTGQCPVCPPGVCLDKVPQGERFGTHCLHMITVADVVRRVEEMLVLRST